MAGSVPRRVKIGYGAGQTGMNSAEVLLRLYLLIFCTDVVGLEPSLAGLAVSLAIIWDAFTDPLMGVVTDHTRSKWGRRRPWIILGGFLLPAALYLVFSPPALNTQFGKFAFLLISYILVNTASTVIGIPHSALGGDLADERKEVTEIYGWRLLFANLGAIIGTVVPGIFLTRMADADPATSIAERLEAHQMAAFSIGIIILISACISFFATRGFDRTPRHTEERTAIRLRPQLRSLLRNRPFIVLSVAYLVATIGTAINSSFAFYYYKYRLELSEQQTQIVIAIFMVIFCAALVGWIWAADRIAKKKLLFGGIFLLGLQSAIAYPLFPAGQMTGPLVTAVFGGILVGSIVLLDAMLIDCIDWDEVRTGRNRAGLYFGVWLMNSKVARAVSVAIAGVSLSYMGFEPNVQQSPEVSLKIALVFGPGVGIFFMLGAFMGLFVPLSEKQISRVRRARAIRATRSA